MKATARALLMPIIALLGLFSGTIDTIPEIPGLAVWHEGHIGIYIGGGEVIHASGTTRGVIKTPIGHSGWTHWLKIPYITYVEETAEPTEPNEPTTTPTQ